MTMLRAILMILIILECVIAISSNGIELDPVNQLDKFLGNNVNSLNYSDLHQILVTQHETYPNKAIKFINQRKNVRSLNGMFYFCFDPLGVGFVQEWHSRALQDSCNPDDLHMMPVPSAFNEILSNTTALNYIGWFWYQTSIPLAYFGNLSNLNAKGDSFFVQFESINYMTLIYAKLSASTKSASLISSHIGGYLPIKAPLGSLLEEASEETDSIMLTLAVSNMLDAETIPSGKMEDLTPVVGFQYKQFKPDFDFFHYAGILGDVNLVRLPAVYIETVIQRAKNCSSFEFDVSMNIEKLRLLPERNIKLKYDLTLGSTTIAGGTKELFDCSSLELCSLRSSSIITKRLKLVPNLRDAHQTRSPKFAVALLITDGGRDTILDFIRVSSIKLNPNWSAVNLHGFGMHQEQYFSGRSMSLASIMKDIYLLKRVGANVIRTSHYPYSTDYLDVCDELDVFVIAECAAVGLNSFSETKLSLHKQLLNEMMWRDHHHPSIIMWSVANEPQSQQAEAKPYFESLLDYARSELAIYTVDAGRPLTAAIAQAHDADRIGHLLDVIMINRYYAWYDYTSALETIRPALLKSLSGWANKHPGKRLMISEYGADTLAGLHKAERGIYTEEFQRDLIAAHEKVFAELLSAKCSWSNHSINFIGSMAWNFADFTTHESLLRVGGINHKGLFTRDRTPKLAVELLREFYKRRNKLNSTCLL